MISGACVRACVVFVQLVLISIGTNKQLPQLQVKMIHLTQMIEGHLIEKKKVEIFCIHFIFSHLARRIYISV